MIRNGDIDGELVWVTGGLDSQEPALILEVEKDKYWVKLVTIDGNLVTQTRYDKLRQALVAFTEALPLDA